MGAPAIKKIIIEQSTRRAREILQGTGNLSRDDLEYVAQQVDKLKDRRLKECVAELMKWGDDERAELETLMAIGLELMKDASPSRLRAAASKVELRHYMRQKS